jgi:large subunit ribosomal protein L22
MADMNKSISRAKLRYVRVSPQKVRLVADLIRGLDVDEALRKLAFTRKRSAPMIGKLIDSAVANAMDVDPTVDVDELFVKTIYVDGGPVLRRFLPRAQGRATRILKRTSHITVELGSR